MVDRAIPIPVPLRGLNTVEPDLPIDAMYARELTNFIIVNGRLRQRPSMGSYKTPAGKTNYTHRPVWWQGNSLILRNSSGEIYNYSTDTITGNVGGSTANIRYAHVVKHSSLELLMGVREPRVNTAPAFTAWTFTTIGITASDIVTATSHKGRLYVAAGTVIEYSNVAAITGTMAGSFNVAEFTNNEPIERLFTFNTQPNQSSDENVFVIITANNILVYAGDFPASQTWNLLVKFPLGTIRELVAEIDGDVFIANENVAFYLSQLLQEGISSINSNPLNAAIKNLWETQLWRFIPNSDGEGSHVWWHKDLDLILCTCSASSLDPYFNQFNLQVTFVFHRKYRAWSLWNGQPFYWPIIEENSNYTGRQSTLSLMVLKKDDFDITFGIQREPQKIECSWKTPFLNPFRGQLQQLSGARIRYRYKRVLRTTGGDFPKTTSIIDKLRSIFDYSDYLLECSFRGVVNVWPFYQQETSSQPIINPENYAELSISVPANTSGNYNIFTGLNGIGEGAGLNVIQKNDVDDPSPSNTSYLETSTTEFEIYGATIYAKDGGVIF